MGARHSLEKKIFQALDSNDDGKITKEELLEWQKDEMFVGNPAYEEIKDKLDFDKLDQDGDGHVTSKELDKVTDGIPDEKLEAVFASIVKARETFLVESLEKVFSLLDENKDGTITIDEFKNVLNVGDKALVQRVRTKTSDVEAFFKRMSEEKNASLTKEEMTKLLSAQSLRDLRLIHEHVAKQAQVLKGNREFRDKMERETLNSKLYSLQKKVKVNEPDYPVHSLAFSKDGTKIVTGGLDNQIRIWSAQTLEVIKSFSDGTTYDPTVNIWTKNLADNSGDHYVSKVAINHDGTKVASSHGDNHVRVWDVETGVCEVDMSDASSNSVSIAFNVDGTRLACGLEESITRIMRRSQTEVVRVLDIAAKEWVFEMPMDRRAGSVAYSPDGKYLAIGFGTKKCDIQIRDALTHDLVRSMTGHRDGVAAVAWSPDSKLLLSGSDDSTVRIWNVETGEELSKAGTNNEIRAVAFHPNGQRVFAASSSKTTLVYDLPMTKGAELQFVPLFSSTYSIAFSPTQPDVLVTTGGTQKLGLEDCNLYFWAPYIESTAAPAEESKSDA